MRLLLNENVAGTVIVSAPKVYAFHTGFSCYYRGWLRRTGEATRN